MQLRPDELASLRIDRSSHHAPAPAAGPGFFGWLFRLALMGGLVFGGYAAGQGKIPQLGQLAQVSQLMTSDPEVVLAPAVKEDDSISSGHLTASGYVVSRTKASLSFKVPGRIATLEVREGALVQTGQVLARLEDSEQRANLARAEAALETAKAALTELKAGSRGQEIQRAESAVREAEANHKNAATNLTRFQVLLDRGGISRQQLDQARMTADMTAAQLESARQALSLAKEGPRREAIVTQQARISEADAGLKVARETLDQTVLHAPFAGTIIERSSEVGETLTFSGDSRQPSGVVVFTLADLRDMEAEVDISETNLAQVVEGAPTEVVADAYPDVKYAGQVRMIMSRANRQKAIVPVKVTILKSDGKLKPDMSAKVSFLSKGQAQRKGPPRILVPAKAIQKRDGKTVVFTVQGGVAKAITVQVSDPDGDRVPVTSGLSGGEDLIVEGLAEVADGTKVRVKKPEQHT